MRVVPLQSTSPKIIAEVRLDEIHLEIVNDPTTGNRHLSVGVGGDKNVRRTWLTADQAREVVRRISEFLPMMEAAPELDLGAPPVKPVAAPPIKLPAPTKPVAKKPDFDGDDEIGEDLDHLKEILDDAETSTRLSEWEDGFCSDMRERVETYGARTFVSARQWEVLERIEEKLNKF